MNDLLELLQQQWTLLAGAPVVVISIVVLAGGIGFAAARGLYAAATEGARATAETARERAQAAREEVERLRQHKDTLLARLDRHGEDITALRKALDEQPRFIVSDRPPGPGDLAREGDFWIQTTPDDPPPSAPGR